LEKTVEETKAFATVAAAIQGTATVAEKDEEEAFVEEKKSTAEEEEEAKVEAAKVEGGT